MRKYLSLLLLPLIIFSCSEDKIHQGEIKYEITYPHLELGVFMSAALPKEMTIVFKEKQMLATLKKGKIFSTTVLSNEETESVRMTLTFDENRIFCDLNKKEVLELINSQPVYTIDSTNKKDSIEGCWATEYAVTSLNDSMPPLNAWFTEDLSIQNGAWFSAYGSIKGMPLIYDVERYGMLMHANCTKFKEREVEDKEFEMEVDLVEVDFETYEKKVQELFDLLLD
jgi:hypothetical protein